MIRNHQKLGALQGIHTTDGGLGRLILNSSCRSSFWATVCTGGCSPSGSSCPRSYTLYVCMVGCSKAFYSSRPGCQQSGVRLILFFFSNFNISSVFGIQDTLLSYNPSGLHSQTPRPRAVVGLGCSPLGSPCRRSSFRAPVCMGAVPQQEDSTVCKPHELMWLTFFSCIGWMLRP